MSSLKDLVFDPNGDVLLLLSKSKASADNDNPTGAEPVDRPENSENVKLKASAGQPHSEGPEEAEKVEVNVSSRHIALASRVFRAMFNGNFSERIQPEDPRLTKVPLPEDDFDAMMALLSIIHGLNRRVPRKIDKSLFVRIAILVDKYELHEVAEVYTDMWFRDLWDLRETSSSDLTDWIYLCWVFNKVTEFRDLTKTAIMESTQHFEDNDLPFPASIATNIEAHRLSAIENVVAYLKKTIERYLSEKQQCYRDKNCDLLVLGDLIKKLKTNALFPLPEAVDLDTSVVELISRLRGIEFSSLCQIRQTPMYGPRAGAQDCVLRWALNKEISRIEEGISGLHLTMMSPDATNKRSVDHARTTSNEDEAQKM